MIASKSPIISRNFPAFFQSSGSIVTSNCLRSTSMSPPTMFSVTKIRGIVESFVLEVRLGCKVRWKAHGHIQLLTQITEFLEGRRIDRHAFGLSLSGNPMRPFAGQQDLLHAGPFADRFDLIHHRIDPLDKYFTIHERGDIHQTEKMSDILFA